MPVLGASSVGVANVAGGGAPKPATQKFGEALKAAQAHPKAAGHAHARQAAKVEAKAAADVTAQRPAARALDQVSAAQNRMEQVLELAQSGKTFTPAELLALQTQMYRASQELDLAGKVVEKATGGVKQVLQTQV